MIEFSYKVAMNFYAGEYPFSKKKEAGLQKLQLLLDEGIRTFIDLTEPVERLTQYKRHLPSGTSYLTFPTVDVTPPQWKDLLKIHDIIKQSNSKCYVHCKGGYDRTGVVVAAYFIYQKKALNAAKDAYYKTVPKHIRTRYPIAPLIERDWTILTEYANYLKHYGW